MKLFYSRTLPRSGSTIHPSEMEEGEYGRFNRWGMNRYYNEYRCKCEDGWLLTKRDGADPYVWNKAWKMTEFNNRSIWHPKEYYEIILE